MIQVVHLPPLMVSGELGQYTRRINPSSTTVVVARQKEERLLFFVRVKKIKTKLGHKSISDLPLPKDICSFLPEASVRQVVAALKKDNIGSAIIVDEQNYVLGIFTERDFLRKVALEDGTFLDDPIRDFMTPNPKSVSRHDTVYKAAAFMRVGRFRHIVVKDEKGKLESVVSVKDLLDTLIDEFE